MVKLDCFAYDKDKVECKCLNELYCEKEKCRFYKDKDTYKKERIKK